MNLTSGFVDSDVDKVDKDANAKNPEGSDGKEYRGDKDSIEDGKYGQTEGQEELSGASSLQFFVIVEHRGDD